MNISTLRCSSTRLLNLHTWTWTGILGNLVSNHSSLSMKCLHIAPTVIFLPPPAFTSISYKLASGEREKETLEMGTKAKTGGTRKSIRESRKNTLLAFGSTKIILFSRLFHLASSISFPVTKGPIYNCPRITTFVQCTCCRTRLLYRCGCGGAGRDLVPGPLQTARPRDRELIIDQSRVFLGSVRAAVGKIERMSEQPME
jgi:hypothetical protein